MALKVSIIIKDEELGFDKMVWHCPDFDLAVEKAGSIMRLYEKYKNTVEEEESN